jgi:hypothetical protein
MHHIFIFIKKLQTFINIIMLGPILKKFQTYLFKKNQIVNSFFIV